MTIFLVNLTQKANTLLTPTILWTPLPIANGADGPKDSIRVEREREDWETEENRHPSRSHRSVSRERWVETMVVADSKLIDYHGHDNVESYIFTIMNMVSR